MLLKLFSNGKQVAFCFMHSDQKCVLDIMPKNSLEVQSASVGASGPFLGSEESTRGSTMMSKSETFHGPAGILTLSSSVPPPPHM